MVVAGFLKFLKFFAGRTREIIENASTVIQESDVLSRVKCQQICIWWEIRNKNVHLGESVVSV